MTDPKLIYFGRLPLEIFEGDKPTTVHNFSDNYNRCIRELGAQYVHGTYYGDYRQIPNCDQRAEATTLVHLLRGVTILYDVIPGSQHRVELFFDSTNSDVSGVEDLILSQKDILPPVFNEIKYQLPKIF